MSKEVGLEQHELGFSDEQIKELEAETGTCLQDTYNFARLDPVRFIIIHAEVKHKSEKVWHSHAAILDKDTNGIVEVSNAFRDKPRGIPFMDWVRMGSVKNIKQYTYCEYSALMLKHKEKGQVFHRFFHLTS